MEISAIIARVPLGVGAAKSAVLLRILPWIMFIREGRAERAMLEDIETLQQRTVMVRIEEMIQSTPDYAEIREALQSLDFIPEQDEADFAIWVQPDLKIFVLLRMNLGGGYAGYKVAACEGMERREGTAAGYNAR